MYSVNLADNGRHITLTSDDGFSARFHAIWLRDNSLDENTRSRMNGQRRIMVSDIQHDLTIKTASIEENLLTLDFGSILGQLTYDPDWLREHAYDRRNTKQNGVLPEGAITWGASLNSRTVTEEFLDVSTTDQGLHNWLDHVRTYGFAILSDGPTEPGSLLTVAELFGYVRETNYGRWFEVRTEVDPNNLAFTNLGLQPHTDNPYRDPVPSLQILYCLENSAEGGENTVVDGFRVATELLDRDPAHFDLLSQYLVPFIYRGTGDVHLATRHPMIELAADKTLRSVRFNSRSIGPITDLPFEKMEAFYDAYRHLSDLIDDPSNQVHFKLKPGSCFIVDNTRVLHGRKAYSDTAGQRWLQGCYPDKDGLLSKLETLKHSFN